MKKAVCTLLVIFAMGILTQAKKLCSFNDEYFKHPWIRIDDNQVYILDQEFKKGVIYDRKNFKKIAEFGAAGQGPGEFTGISHFSINHKNIYITTYNKLSIFSKKGQLIKELKVKIYKNSYKPIGNQYVAIHYPPNDPNKVAKKVTFSLYGPGLKKNNDIFSTEVHRDILIKNGKRLINWIRDCVDCFVYKDKIYIGTTEKGFYFVVLDKEGQKLYEIKKEARKRKITELEKQTVIKGMRMNMGAEKWNRFKTNNEYIFSEYYPEYKAFFVNDDKIYVFLFPQFGVYEILILDLKGNLVKKTYMATMAIWDVGSNGCCISKGKLYRLKEDFENETWELHEFDLMQ